MSMDKAGLALLTGGVSLLFVAACGSADDSEGPATLEGAEASLNETQGSREDARAAAKACFDTYGTCQASDHACREDLESCLRDAVDLPRACGPHDDHHGHHAKSCDDHDRYCDEGPNHKAKHHKHHCHTPIPDKALHECREDVEHSLADGQDPAVVSQAYDQCVQDAFADGIAKLCDKLDELCANANAPADTCDRITGACNTP